jgi:hypothetical protein
VEHIVKPVVHPLQGANASDVNWDTKLEIETLANPDVRLKSVAFEIGILKPVVTATTTPTAK